MSQKLKHQTFNDGIVNLYEISDISESGDMPSEALTLKYENIRIHKRTVGMARFWEAKQNNVQIDKLIRIPKVGELYQGYIAVINGTIDDDKPDAYEVKQIQEPEEIYPPVLDLSLERMEQIYGTE